MESIELVDWIFMGFLLLGLFYFSALWKVMLEIKNELGQIRQQLGYGMGGNQSYVADIKESLESIESKRP